MSKKSKRTPPWRKISSKGPAPKSYETKFVVITEDQVADMAEVGDFLQFVFSKTEVLEGMHDHAIQRLEALSDNPRIVSDFQGRLSFSFDGWDDDPREVHEIAEIVEFFRVVTRSWPYWYHFIETNGDTFSIMMTLLCVRTGMVKEGEHVGVYADPNTMIEVMQQLYMGLNVLHERHGVSDEVNFRVSQTMERLTTATINRS